MPEVALVQSCLRIKGGRVRVYVDGLYRGELQGEVEDFTDFSNSQEEEE